MSRFDHEPIQRTTTYAAIDEGLRTFMVKVFAYMALGLSISAITSFMMLDNPALMMAIMSNQLFLYAVIFAPLVMVIFISARLNKMPATTARTLFWVYAMLMGVSLSMTLAFYTTESILNVFLVSASLFGSMALYGYTTQKDLTAMGSFLMMGVMGLFIAYLVNMFLGNGPMNLILSGLTAIIFTGLTAYDVQNIKALYYESDNSEVATKKAVYGALLLYIDFINIFMSLLRFFGNRR